MAIEEIINLLYHLILDNIVVFFSNTHYKALLNRRCKLVKIHCASTMTKNVIILFIVIHCIIIKRKTL